MGRMQFRPGGDASRPRLGLLSPDGFGVAVVVYALLLVAAAALVWRRPVVALYAWIVGLALHNAVMAALYGAGVRGTR